MKNCWTLISLIEQLIKIYHRFVGPRVPPHRDSCRYETDDGVGRRRPQRVHQPGEHSASV